MDFSPVFEYNSETISYEENSDFNEEFDEQEGGYVAIGGYQFRPSFILFTVEPVGYHTALVEFRQDAIEKFKEFVYSKFPTPIAFVFERFERGYENQQQRLKLLQDTWESIIYLLYALIVSEYRHFRFSMTETAIKPKQIVSNKIDDRLSIIEQLITLAIDKNHPLPCLNYISNDVVDKLRELNRVRNEFSHSFAKTDLQCRQTISRYQGDVLNILQGISEISSITLARYVSQEESILSFRHEDFKGASLNRTFSAKDIMPDKLDSVSYHLNSRNVLAIHGEDIYCVTPFVHFRLDDIGNPKLCFYKQKRGRDVCLELFYEVLDGSGEVPLGEDQISKADFVNAINEIKNLLPDLSGRGSS
ncbi:hypothetical protein [Phormidium tenue]|uniref:Uncharacterized protein n=1 Tax=Phormidium tenue NIES-30 TaxID=549789 RepID=A0A1U7J909_9CYAN|nr:hypothetical protein [Phormidium tenue]MBD2230968.1 hypothetical protein [Phormidium tenue FACHB-1052]OKH49997.1 hypothetical protein NIES30_04615 [Phormidium tenue NIES-30]